MAGNKQHDKKRTTNGEPNEQPGSPAQDPRRYDPERMTGNENTGEYDAQRERRREDEETEVNEPL